jgi:hypothetical protein
VRALFIYAVGGVILGFASMVDAIIPGLPAATGLAGVFGMTLLVVLLLALKSGPALVLLLLMSSERRRARLFGWTDVQRVT